MLFYSFYLFSNVAKTPVDYLLLFSLQLDEFKYASIPWKSIFILLL